MAHVLDRCFCTNCGFGKGRVRPLHGRSIASQDAGRILAMAARIVFAIMTLVAVLVLGSLLGLGEGVG